MNYSRQLFASIALAFATACSPEGGLGSASIDRTIPPEAASSPLGAPQSGQYLYVANYAYPGYVTVYPSNGKVPVRTISQGATIPELVDFDKSGNLYVANCILPCQASSGGSITVYAAGTTKLLRTISLKVLPSAMVLDNSGNVYVGSFDDSTISVFAAGKNIFLRKITKGLDNPTALVFAANGDLYVGNAKSNTVAIYPPNGSSPVGTISSYSPEALAFGQSGDLYVANRSTDSNLGSVTVYAPTTNKKITTITKGIDNPTALDVNSSNDLYVANYNGNSVTVYSPDGKNLLRRISQGMQYPTSFAFGSENYLYVAGFTAVTVYAPSSSKLTRTITRGINDPMSVAFGP